MERVAAIWKEEGYMAPGQEVFGNTRVNLKQQACSLGKCMAENELI